MYSPGTCSHLLSQRNTNSSSKPDLIYSTSIRNVYLDTNHIGDTREWLRTFKPVNIYSGRQRWLLHVLPLKEPIKSLNWNKSCPFICDPWHLPTVLIVPITERLLIWWSVQRNLYLLSIRPTFSLVGGKDAWVGKVCFIEVYSALMRDDTIRYSCFWEYFHIVLMCFRKEVLNSL